MWIKQCILTLMQKKKKNGSGNDEFLLQRISDSLVQWFRIQYLHIQFAHYLGHNYP